jgi:hypothetical protein
MGSNLKPHKKTKTPERMGIMLGLSLPLVYLQKLSFRSKTIEPRAILRNIYPIKAIKGF